MLKIGEKVSEKNINTEPISNANTIAQFILDYYREKKIEIDLITHLKLLYICFGYISAWEKRYLFSEDIEAWHFGPVVPDIYFFLRSRLEPPFKIPTYIKFIDVKEKLTEEIKKNIEIVLKIYLDKGGFELVKMTHLSGGPWDVTYQEGWGAKVIDKKFIIKYYREKMLNLKD